MIKDKIVKLLNVKSIVTILLTILFMVLSIRGTVSSEVINVYTIVIAFYFGTQSEKKHKDE